MGFLSSRTQYLNRRPNMFSFTAGQAHAKRKRIFASAYSKTSITQNRVQNIIKSRVAKLVRFIETQTNTALRGDGSPVVIRHMFRALQADVFTAFAFSESNGSKFLDNLKSGSNTMEDLGMEDMDLFHDERRDDFFFWESEIPFKYLSRFIARRGAKAHAAAQKWLYDFVSRHEAESLPRTKVKAAGGSVDAFSATVYGKLLMYRNPESGIPLSWAEKASEIMDHAGTRQRKGTSKCFSADSTASRRARCSPCSSRIYRSPNQLPRKRAVPAPPRITDYAIYERRGATLCSD